MSIEVFGTQQDGQTVHRIAFGAGSLRAAVLTRGAILHELRLGGGPSLTAGSATLDDYTRSPLSSAGAVVGPVANRIGGASAVLDGRRLHFDANGAGGHSLHGGDAGLGKQVWQIAATRPDAVTLELRLPDGLGGYPGNRVVQAAYDATPDAVTLTLTATTDRPTLMAPANHSYWILGPVDGTELHVAADRYLPTDATVLPTGEIAPVAGTRFDLRQGKRLGPEDRFDHGFCLSEQDQPLRDVARLVAGGYQMDMATTAMGLQVFTADGFAAPGPLGHDGRLYGPRFGLALEAQGWPDAPNNPAFPSMRLDPGQSFRQVTRWRFAAA